MLLDLFQVVLVALAWGLNAAHRPAVVAPAMEPHSIATEAALPPGRIEGMATISRRIAAPRARVRLYEEPGNAPRPQAGPSHPFENVVLYLESVPAPGGQSARVAEMRQRGERFVPHVLPVVVGSTVQFPNDDPIYHNVFSLSRARTFDLGRFANGGSKSVTFPAAGVVQVFCHIHADMSGYILVLANSFFVVPDRQGRFMLDGVPAGEYRLIAWHERIRPTVARLTVTAGSTTSIGISIPLEQAP